MPRHSPPKWNSRENCVDFCRNKLASRASYALSRRRFRRNHRAQHFLERMTTVKKLLPGIVICGLALVVGCQTGSTSSAKKPPASSAAAMPPTDKPADKPADKP